MFLLGTAIFLSRAATFLLRRGMFLFEAATFLLGTGVFLLEAANCCSEHQFGAPRGDFRMEEQKTDGVTLYVSKESPRQWL